MLLLALALIAQVPTITPAEAKLTLNCQPINKQGDIECVGLKWTLSLRASKVPDPKPVDPINPLIPSTDKMDLRSDLKPLAYSYDHRTDMVWPEKAGESAFTPFGTILTRLTDKNTKEGASIAHYYSDRAAMCGRNVVVTGDGGFSGILNIDDKVIRPLNYVEPSKLNISSYQWRNCDSLYLVAEPYGSSNRLGIWEYQPSTRTFREIRKIENEVKAVLPQPIGLYANMAWLSPDGKRMVLSIERASKDAQAVALIDENGTRVYPLNPVPSNYTPKLNATFKGAGVGGVTKTGSHYVIQYNGLIKIGGFNVSTMSYVIPWNEDPTRYAAISIFGNTATNHGASLNSGVIHISGAENYGETLDPSREECKTLFPGCAGSPNWWYTLRLHDYTKTPDPERGYPSKRMTAYTLAAGGYHLASSPDNKMTLSSTYQEFIGTDGYLIKSATHNELFLTYNEDPEIEWVSPNGGPPKAGSPVKPKANSRIIRLSEVNNHYDQGGYWASPRATFDMTGCVAIFTSTGGRNTFRTDVYMVTGYCK